MSISKELAPVANEAMEEYKNRSKIKREGRVTKKGVGKTVACYVSADDVKKLEQAAELLGSSQSGVVHTALMIYLDKLLQIPVGLDPAFAEVVNELGPPKKEWLPGRHPDPNFIFGEPEKKK